MDSDDTQNGVEQKIRYESRHTNGVSFIVSYLMSSAVNRLNVVENNSSTHRAPTVPRGRRQDVPSLVSGSMHLGTRIQKSCNQ